MPVPRNGVISYIIVPEQDADRTRSYLRTVLSGQGVTLEESNVVTNDRYPEGWTAGQRMVAFCSSNDIFFNLGTSEISALNGRGVLPGLLNDDRGTVAASVIGASASQVTPSRTAVREKINRRRNSNLGEIGEAWSAAAESGDVSPEMAARARDLLDSFRQEALPGDAPAMAAPSMKLQNNEYSVIETRDGRTYAIYGDNSALTRWEQQLEGQGIKTVRSQRDDGQEVLRIRQGSAPDFDDLYPLRGPADNYKGSYTDLAPGLSYPPRTDDGAAGIRLTLSAENQERTDAAVAAFQQAVAAENTARMDRGELPMLAGNNVFRIETGEGYTYGIKGTAREMAAWSDALNGGDDVSMPKINAYRSIREDTGQEFLRIGVGFARSFERFHRPSTTQTYQGAYSDVPISTEVGDSASLAAARTGGKSYQYQEIRAARQ